MKLCAIYNVFDGVELLKGSMQCLRGEVDLFIIVWQDVSNRGEKYNPYYEITEAIQGIDAPILLRKYTPDNSGGAANERNKRSFGIEIAMVKRCTHFLSIDVDEYYQDFAAAKQAYIKSGAKGSVCKIFTYFKKPTLRFETEDNYYVPFIHELKPDTVTGVKQYPFYVDPTRRINESDVALLDVHMHHYSWVRKDIERKVRNSSANLKASKLLEAYYSDIKPGTALPDYGNKSLIEVPNHFGIEIETHSVKVTP